MKSLGEIRDGERKTKNIKKSDEPNECAASSDCLTVKTIRVIHQVRSIATSCKGWL